MNRPRNSWGIGRRGQGLDAAHEPSRPAPELIQQPEDEPAVRARPKRKPRTYRISTYITDDNGDLLEDMRRLIRKETGRNPKIAEVIEIALHALEKDKLG